MIVNRLIVILIFIFFKQILFAQNIEFKASNFKKNKKEYEKAKKELKFGDDLRDLGLQKVFNFQEAEDLFLEAIYFYKKVYEFNPNNALLNFKIGSSFLFTNQKELSYKYFLKAKSLDDYVSEDFLFYYAIALQLNGNFNKAIETFELFASKSKEKLYKKYELLCKKYIEECYRASQIEKEELRIWIDKLNINTKYDEWSPCLSADGDLLIFTSNRPNGKEPNNIGGYDHDIYYSNLIKRSFEASNPITELNTANDDVSGGLAYDGQRLLICKKEDGNSDVYESKLVGTKWSHPVRKMGDKNRGANSNMNETFASYDPPDIKVYYITDGGYNNNQNIYFSGVMNSERNLWGKGQSAGHELNTKFQEGSVYIHPDGRTMYFSSKGHDSFGGYDIFVSYVDELGHWGPPINLGYPINTVYDDLFYSATASGRCAYISSNRPGGEGGLDIYKITYWGADKPMTSDYEDQLISSIQKPISDNFIAEPIIVEEKSLTVFKGRILDAVTKNPIRAEIIITINSTGKIYTTSTSNSVTGKFLLSLPSGSNYGISVNAEGYLFHSENFNLPKNDGFNMVVKDVNLKNIKVGSNITLNNVFFDTGKWDVKSDSNSELERLIQLLNDIPNLKIEIAGHTDNTGNSTLNKNLSEKRAESVVKYLVNNGISASRLSAKGYGDTQPISSNDTKDGRSQNRRTEFRILKN